MERRGQNWAAARWRSEDCKSVSCLDAIETVSGRDALALHLAARPVLVETEWPGRGSVKEERKGKSMNGPHKFGTEFGSDNAPEHNAAIVSHHDSIKWFEAIPGEQLCIRVYGTQVNGRYAIMENIAAPGTATPMHFHAEDEIFTSLQGL